MSKKDKKIKIQIMSEDNEKFMAFEGLLQWAQEVVFQGERVDLAAKQLSSIEHNMSSYREKINRFHCEQHYFVIASNKFLEYREWINKFGLCKSVDFDGLDLFSKRDIKDLRDMREHVIHYFKGEGWNNDRWVVGNSEYSTDASSCTGTMIGGRLDYLNFSKAVEVILFQLLKEPVPYPPLDVE